MHADCNTVTLALHALSHEQSLDIGWDHDTGVKTPRLAQATPRPQNLTTRAAGANELRRKPHFYRLLAIKQRDEA
jgi:hypothetical protein